MDVSNHGDVISLLLLLSHLSLVDKCQLSAQRHGEYEYDDQRKYR